MAKVKNIEKSIEGNTSFWHPVNNFHRVLFLIWLFLSFYIAYKSDAYSGGSFLNMIIGGPLVAILLYPFAYFLFWVLIRKRNKNEGFKRFAKDEGKAVLMSVGIIVVIVALFLGYFKIQELLNPPKPFNPSDHAVFVPDTPTPTETPKPQYANNDIYDPNGNLKNETKFVFDPSTTVSSNSYAIYSFSSSLHNNSSYNVDELYIRTNVYKSTTQKCSELDKLIDSRDSDVIENVPADGVKMISFALYNANYPTDAKFCTFVKSAHIQY